MDFRTLTDGAFRPSIINALGSIGTSASIPTLNEFIKSRTTIHGPDGHAQITKIVVEKIEQREQRKNRRAAHKTPNSEITTPNQQVTNDVSLGRMDKMIFFVESRGSIAA